MKELTDKQWYMISEYTSNSTSIPLRELDIEEPFLYVRGIGVFM